MTNYKIDNACISGALCYISSARNTYTEQALLTVCQSFYSFEKISDAKKILFAITGSSTTQRRGESKLKSDLTDIFAEFKRLDENNITIPQFLADGYSSMPPVSGYELLAEHLVSFVGEVHDLRNRIDTLSTVVDSIKDNNVTDIKEELYDKEYFVTKELVVIFKHCWCPVL